MEDLPHIETALTATKVRYLNAINDLSRVVLPSVDRSEYSIDNCKTGEMESLATELGLSLYWNAGLALLEIETPTYTLSLWGRVFNG